MTTFLFKIWLITLWLGATTTTYYDNELYIRETVVIHINRSTDTVSVMDGQQNIWRFSEIEDWADGDRCRLYMWDNGTPNYIYDDVICDARYTGYIYQYDNRKHFVNIGYPDWFDGGSSTYTSK